MSLDRSEWNAPGHLPESVAGAALGSSTATAVAGGDVRIFFVRVREQGIEEIPHQVPLARPVGRALFLRHVRSIQEEILARPTFFQHFDSAVIDWRYLHERTEAALGREGRWVRLQGLRMITDLTSGFNLYPDLRLIDNIDSDFTKSMSAVEDVSREDAGHRLARSHRFPPPPPENNFTREQTWAAFEKTLRRICGLANTAGITIHLRMTAGKPPATLEEAAEFLTRVAAPNLKIAPSTSLLLASGEPALVTLPPDKLGLWLLAAPQRDIGGAVWNHHAPIAGSEVRLRSLLSAAPNALLILDAVYDNADQEYLDAAALRNF